jgi:hypothetical protein
MLSNHPRIRLGIYLTGVGLGAAAAIVGVTINGDLGAAFTVSGGVLTAAALGVAAANTPSDS